MATEGVDDALDVDAETVLGGAEGEGGDAAEGFVGRGLLLGQLGLFLFWGEEVGGRHARDGIVVFEGGGGWGGEPAAVFEALVEFLLAEVEVEVLVALGLGPRCVVAG